MAKFMVEASLAGALVAGLGLDLLGRGAARTLRRGFVCAGIAIALCTAAAPLAWVGSMNGAELSRLTDPVDFEPDATNVPVAALGTPRLTAAVHSSCWNQLTRLVVVL